MSAILYEGGDIGNVRIPVKHETEKDVEDKKAEETIKYKHHSVVDKTGS